MTYIPEIWTNPMNKISMTGNQVNGTSGHELLDNSHAEIDGRVMPVSAQAEFYDFSVHAARDGLFAFLGSCSDSQIRISILRPGSRNGRYARVYCRDERRNCT